MSKVNKVFMYAHDPKISCERFGVADRKSQTVPDQSYSIKDLLSKHVHGVDLSVSNQPIWMEMDIDDVDMEKLGQYDLFDKEQTLVKAKEIILQAGKEAAQRAAAAKELEDRGRVKSSSKKYDESKKDESKGGSGGQVKPGEAGLGQRPRKSGTSPSKDES